MDKRENIIVQFIFWIVCFLLINRIFGLREEMPRALLNTFVLVGFLASITYLNIFVLVPKYFLKRKYLLYTILIFLLVVLPPYLLFKFNYLPVRGFRAHRLHRSFFHLPPKFVLLILINSSFIFISTIIRLALNSAQKEKQRIQLERERLLIETQYLRSQMNPHFFLNALNNLQYINRFLPKESNKYINTLAEMMRYVTYDCREAQVLLSKEIDYIWHYIYFQQVKDEDIKVSFQIDIQDETTLIEPMLLMPFVENAFKYTPTANSETEAIKIEIKQDKKGIYFTCENPRDQSIQSNTDPSYSGVGIKNVEERLKVAYPNRYELKINATEHFRVSLSLYTE